MELGKPQLIRTFVARVVEKDLQVRVPGEVWTYKVGDAFKSESAARYIRENGIGCADELIQGLLQEC